MREDRFTWSAGDVVIKEFKCNSCKNKIAGKDLYTMRCKVLGKIPKVIVNVEEDCKEYISC